MVTGANRWLVEVRLSGQQGVSGVARNHLPHAFYSGARRIEKGVTGALATYTGHASLAPPYAKDRQSWQDRRRGLDQRTSRRSEEQTSELQSLMRIPYAVFFLKKKTQKTKHNN